MLKKRRELGKAGLGKAKRRGSSGGGQLASSATLPPPPVADTSSSCRQSGVPPGAPGQLERSLRGGQFGAAMLRRAMGTRELLLVVCLLAAGSAVGDAQSSPPPAPAPPPQPTPFGRAMSTVITVAISVFFFLLFLCAYINQCRLRDPGAYGAAGAAAAAAAGGGPSRRGKRGLDPAVVATFPIVRYREIVEHKIGKGVLECAVCLTSFEDSDDLRLLPHCSHAFHPECIDPWLQARVTCPLCRANLEKSPPPSPAPASPEQRHPSPSPSPLLPQETAVAIPAAADESDEEEDRKEEAMELEMLRSARRAARMPRSHSTGHSLFAAASEEGDHERFTLRLPAHVREEVLRSRRLRHATSLINLSDVSSSEGSSRGGRRAGAGGFGNGNGNGLGGRRWHAFLARTVSWARGGGDGSVRKGWDGSTRRGRDAGESSLKGAASPTAPGRP